MDVLGTQYQDAFRQQNIVAIAHPTMPFPAPLLPTEGHALPPTLEVGGRQYPDTAILRNALPGPAFRAPALSIPRGLHATVCRWGSRSMGCLAVTTSCCVSAWPLKLYLSRCHLRRSATVKARGGGGASSEHFVGRPQARRRRLQRFPSVRQGLLLRDLRPQASIAPSRTARCDPGDRNRAARGQRGTKS